MYIQSRKLLFEYHNQITQIDKAFTNKKVPGQTAPTGVARAGTICLLSLENYLLITRTDWSTDHSFLQIQHLNRYCKFRNFCE